MKLTLTKREQKLIAILGGLMIVISYVYVSFILGPLTHETIQLGQRVREAHQRVQGLETIVVNEPALRAQYGQWEEKVKSLRALLPSRDEESATLEKLSSLARKSQIKIQAIFPQRPKDQPASPKATPKESTKPEPTVYEDVLIQVDASGGYHQLGTFISLVEADKRPLRISSLRIVGNPKEMKNHNIKLLIRAYFATGQPSHQSS